MATVFIDSAPLIASPEATGNLRECELLHRIGGQMYLAPMNPPGSPLYVADGWRRTPSVVIEVRRMRDGKWSYMPRDAVSLLAGGEGQFETDEQALERAMADRTIPKGAAFVRINPNPTLVFHTDPGHGWLESTLGELKRLGIESQITSYSYIDRSVDTDFDKAKVYLEEDCDAPVLIKAYKDQGLEPSFVTRHLDNTFIRRLPSYSPTL